MFIKAGNHTINTDNVTHIFHYEDTGNIQIKFVDGDAIVLQSTEARAFLTQLSTKTN